MLVAGCNSTLCTFYFAKKLSVANCSLMVGNMFETCEICEETDLFTIDFKNTWSPLFEDKKILVCEACGFGRIMPQLDQKQDN